MIDSGKIFEKYLQNYRFRKVKKYLRGNVLDFGGNQGELKPFVTGNYLMVNYDRSPMYNKSFDTIVLLAVIEHIEVTDVYTIFSEFQKILTNDGIIFLSTPTPKSKFILESLAKINILDKQNIEEHKHYWNKEDILNLAQKTGFKIDEYKKFQLGFNQYAILKHTTT